MNVPDRVGLGLSLTEIDHLLAREREVAASPGDPADRTTATRLVERLETARRSYLAAISARLAKADAETWSRA